MGSKTSAEVGAFSVAAAARGMIGHGLGFRLKGSGRPLTGRVANDRTKSSDRDRSMAEACGTAEIQKIISGHSDSRGCQVVRSKPSIAAIWRSPAPERQCACQPLRRAAMVMAAAAWPASRRQYRKARSPYFQDSRQKMVLSASANPSPEKWSRHAEQISEGRSIRRARAWPKAL